MNVNIKLFENGQNPVFKHDGDACADCYARIAGGSIAIPIGTRCLVNLGFAIEVPAGYEAVIRPRSGLSLQGADVAIGTIDSSYRGEVKACVINNKGERLVVNNGDRICQIAIRKVEPVSFNVVDELSETERGDNGFGSSGLR